MADDRRKSDESGNGHAASFLIFYMKNLCRVFLNSQFEKYSLSGARASASSCFTMNEMGICWVGVQVGELMDTERTVGRLRIPDSNLSAPAFKRRITSLDLVRNAKGQTPLFAW